MMPLKTTPAARPQRVQLQGRLVTLAPLDRVAHGDALYQAICIDPDALGSTR